MLRAIRLTSVVAMMLSAVPVCAQVYRWVDEHGVTNYSSKPPAYINAGVKPATVADRISVYTSEPAVQPASNAIPASRDRMLSDRIDLLERQLAAERQSSQYAAAADARAAQAAYDQCLAERRVDCDYDSRYYPYGSAGVITVFQHRPRLHIPAVARSGVGAGNFRAAIRAPGRSMHAVRGVAHDDTASLRSDGNLRRAGIFRH